MLILMECNFTQLILCLINWVKNVLSEIWFTLSTRPYHYGRLSVATVGKLEILWNQISFFNGFISTQNMRTSSLVFALYIFLMKMSISLTVAFYAVLTTNDDFISWFSIFVISERPNVEAATWLCGINFCNRDLKWWSRFEYLMATTSPWKFVIISANGLKIVFCEYIKF